MSEFFEYGTPESVGIPSAAIERLIDTMCLHPFGQETHGFTIIRHNKIVAEGNFAPFDGSAHVIHSCSKAFTATAIGFAQKEGLLNVDDPIMKYLSDLAPTEHAPELDRLTIRTLLTMTNGHSINVFKWPYSDILPKKLKENFMAAPFAYEPGTKFAYDNTNSYMMAEIIKRLTGLDPIDYLRPRLLDKLGLDPYYERDFDGMFVGYGTMRLTREELARFGKFYMDGCVLNGERLLSEEWAKEATRRHITNSKQTSTPGHEHEVEKPTEWNQGYAFHMWRGQFNSFRLCGAFGQVCACYPDYDIMLCVNSGHTTVIQDVFDSFYENILTKLTDRLPADPTALASLRRRCENLALPAQFSAPSPLIPTIDHRTWTLSDCGEITTARLDFSEKVCHISLAFTNGESFDFDAGLSDYAYTDAPDSHIVEYQPKDNAVCAATGCWTTLNEFAVTAHMLPTHAMFALKFTFTPDGGNWACTLEPTYFRANKFGTKPPKTVEG